MKRLFPIVAIIGGYLIYHFYETKKAIDNLQIRLAGVSLDTKNTGLLDTVIHVVLSIYNPAPVALAFDQFIGSVLYQGKQVAAFNVGLGQQKQVILANSVSQVPMDAAILNINTLSILPALIANGFKNSDLQIVGTIIINGISVPYSQIGASF